jgi:4-hydroxybenzoate polyprenyltransferase
MLTASKLPGGKGRIIVAAMETKAERVDKWRAWLELLRVPNLLTVPGDVLAGWLLAVGSVWHPALLWAVLASLGLYAFGLISNDVADFKVDSRERPQRPLPSRRILPIHAVTVAMTLACVAPVLAWIAGGEALNVAVLLFLVITFYNTMMKSSPVVGPLALGLCRGLNLLLGAAASTCVLPSGLRGVPFEHMVGVGTAALVLLVYIAMVSLLAQREVQTGRAWLVGALLRGLLPLQALFCIGASLWLDAGAAGWFVAAELLVLWPVAGWLSKRFYMS